MKKTLLAILLAASATLATAQVRQEKPVTVSLRNVQVSNPAFKQAYADVLKDIEDAETRKMDPEQFHAGRMARMTKENPQGLLLTEKQFAERLKKGEKFTLKKNALEKCPACKGDKPAGCEPCKGKGSAAVIRTVTYSW